MGLEVKVNSFHISTTINGMLNKSDDTLQAIFGGYGSDIRYELEQRKANGELLIGSTGCDGFCPVNGCPGHEVKEVKNGG